MDKIDNKDNNQEVNMDKNIICNRKEDSTHSHKYQT